MPPEEMEKLKKALEGLNEIVRQQEKDDDLWCYPSLGPSGEADLQVALRQLHREIKKINEMIKKA